MHSFKEKILQGKTLLGTLVTMGSPIVTEMLSKCGFEWLFIDMEHSPLSLNQVQLLIQSKTKECAALIRIPSNDETWIKQVLDLGADGIIIPLVKTAEEASRAVAAAKYPPAGQRSIGLARAHTFGMEFSSYLEQANNNISIIALIEDKQGVENIDEILQVVGIDAIMIGPYDLSGSYGKLGQVEDSEIKQAIQIIHDACHRHKKPVGIFALKSEQAKAYLKQGYQLVATGIDFHYLWNAAKESLANISNAL